MDTPERNFYDTHNAGIKDRIKIRTRHYVDSDLVFFEFKHRDHDVVRKYRYTIDMTQHGQLDDTAKNFVNETHQAIYGTDFSSDLAPSMITKYKRLTFVHKQGGQRITIDLNLKFGLPDAKKKDYNMPDIAIIELKTAEKETTTHDIFARHNISQKSACSKYCLAHYYLDEVSNRDHFTHTIKHIEELAKADISKTLESQPYNTFSKDHTVTMKSTSLLSAAALSHTE
jgi:hypothetical protein